MGRGGLAHAADNGVRLIFGAGNEVRPILV